MAKYKLTNTKSIIRTTDGACISDPESAEHIEYSAWLAEGNTPDPYVPPLPPVPSEISDWQFFQQLAIEGIITEEQALASNTGIIPPPLMEIIEQMPEEKQFSAKMIVSGAKTYYRNNQLTIDIGTAYGKDDDEIDNFFRAASLL